MHSVDIIIILTYLFVTFFVGIYFGKGVKSLKDYAVGNRSFTVPILVATIFATMSGGNTVIGTSERLFAVGFIFLLTRLGDPIYKLLMARFVVPRMGRLSECISVGELLKDKFGLFGQILGGGSAFIKSIGSVSGQITAIAIFMNAITGLSFFVSVIISSSIVIIYASYGGIRSVVMTDVIQFSVLIIGIPVLTAISLHTAGGYEIVISKISSQHLSIPKRDIVWYGSLFVLSAIPIMNPALVQRLLITRNLKFLEKSFKVSAFTEVPFLIMITLLVGSAFVLNPDISPNNVIPTLINTVLPIGVRGLVIAGMMAIIMSTADSFLNTASVSFMNDIFKPLYRKKLSHKSELFFVRFISVLVGLFAILSALYFKNIFNIYMAFLNVWIPVVVVPIYAVIFDYQCNKKDLILGAISGIASWLCWKFFVEDFIPVHPLLISLICNFIVFFRKGILGFIFPYDVKKKEVILLKKLHFIYRCFHPQD